MSDDVSVSDESAANRYVIDVDGARAGLLTYRRNDRELALLHTEIDPEVERHGLGSTLVEHALDDARRRGLNVAPYCPFVRHYMREHDEYQDLVPAESRASFGL
jgi:hypothetical protein